MANFGDFQAGNAAFAASFKDGDKAMPPARKALLLTCMDGARGREGWSGRSGRARGSCPRVLCTPCWRSSRLAPEAPPARPLLPTP